MNREKQDVIYKFRLLESKWSVKSFVEEVENAEGQWVWVGLQVSAIRKNRGKSNIIDVLDINKRKQLFGARVLRILSSSTLNIYEHVHLYNMKSQLCNRCETLKDRGPKCTRLDFHVAATGHSSTDE